MEGARIILPLQVDSKKITEQIQVTFDPKGHILRSLPG